MRIPSAEQFASHCLTSNYRRCDVSRRFLTVLAERLERWRSTLRTRCTAVAPARGGGRRAQRASRSAPAPQSMFRSARPYRAV